jgi:phage shock protein E
MKGQIYRWIVVMLVAVMALGGCGAQLDAKVTQDTQTTEALLADLGPDVSPETVAQLNAAGMVTVIDVREPWEYDEGHIAGAILIPLGTLPERVDEIPVDQPVILVCRSANRSAQAYRFLQGQGLENIHNMSGGMIAWQAEGHPIEK